MSDDLVSIITPSHNCGPFLRDAISSMLAQTYTNWELILVDDFSTDNTQEIVNSYKDSRIRYFRNDERIGAALSRNRALREAKGRWIAFLDGDDYWLPNKLEHQIRFMQDHNYHFSYHEYSEITEDGSLRGINVSGKRRVTKLDMYSCCWPGCLTVMYDADYVGLIQIRDVAKNNDTAMWLRVIQKTECYLLKENLARYRRRKESITPPGLHARIYWHYRLFSDAEQMNPVAAWFWTGMNMAGNMFKKVFYVTKQTS